MLKGCSENRHILQLISTYPGIECFEFRRGYEGRYYTFHELAMIINEVEDVSEVPLGLEKLIRIR